MNRCRWGFAPRALWVASALAVAAAQAGAPTEDVAVLRFSEFYRSPIGPRGLEPSARLLSQDGRQVRISGFMVHAELPTEGLLILAPLPVTLGDEDESFSDDLPASAVYVHLSEAFAHATPAHVKDRLTLDGVLQLGARPEADGRHSQVRLLLDAGASQRLLPPATISATTPRAAP